MTARDKRLTLIAATLGSFVALLDSTVVRIALRAIHGDLGGDLQSQQWIVNADLGGAVSMSRIHDPRRAQVASRDPQLVGSD